MTIAKSLGGSLVPISATVFTEELREFLIPNPFIHLSTFGGSDLACAVALEVLAVIEETGLVEHAAAMGERLVAGLHAIAAAQPDVIAEVRGLGLMAGLKYAEDSLGPRMSYHLARHGVLAIYSGNEPSVMRLMPSLVIGEAEVDFLLEAIEAARRRPAGRRRPERGAATSAPAPPARATRRQLAGMRSDGGLARDRRGAGRLHGQLQHERAAAQDAARLVAGAALRVLGQRR